MHDMWDDEKYDVDDIPWVQNMWLHNLEFIYFVLAIFNTLRLNLDSGYVYLVISRSF